MESRKDWPDAGGLAELSEAYAEALPKLRRRTGGRSAEIEDAVQEACVRMLQAKRSVALERPVRYLLRAVHNLLVDEWRGRSRARDVPLVDDAELLGADALDPERILSARQELDIVMRAIEALPPRCREAFSLRRFGGLSHAAIARRMGISTRMVEMHMAEAMLKLGRAVSGAEARQPVSKPEERPVGRRERNVGVDG